MSRSSKRARLKVLLLLPSLGLALLALMLLAGMIHSLPERAAEQFGAPSPSLSSAQLYYQSLVLILNAEGLTSPTDQAGGSVQVEIRAGDSIGVILSRLEAAGLLDDPAIFRTYLIYSGADTRIQAGAYQLEPSLTPLELAQRLQDPTPQQTSLTILPGWRVEEIAATFPDLGLTLSGAEFLKQVREQSREGYLFPGVYQVNRKINPEDLLVKLVDAFHSDLDGPRLEGFQTQGLTIQEAVTLASIVEREAVRDQEMPLIASVFLNRLKRGMPLEADPTVQYARGFNQTQGTWWTNPLSQSDLTIDSPYNTYLYPGLPPGPICNPGGKALDAVAHPAETDYYFFRAACDGSGRHIFSRDYQSHLEAACP